MLEDLVGLVGMLALVSAFLLNLTGNLSAASMIYKVLNLVGAAILAWYGVVKETYIFTVLETIWALAALYSMVKGGEPAASEG
ncbi:MAG: CBU_0592 family membrane protein [Candidatus Binatia bacterium]